MANTIRMTPDALYKYVADLQHCADSVAAAQSQIKEVLCELRKGWSGDGLDTHITEIEDNSHVMEKMCQDLIALAAELDQAAKAVEQSESQVASMFKMLF